MKTYRDPKDHNVKPRILEQLKQALTERERLGELSHQLGNTRNAKIRECPQQHMTVHDKNSELSIAMPRDRDGSFKPRIIPKHQGRWNGFDDKCIVLYARGMTLTGRKKVLASTQTGGTKFWFSVIT